MTRYPGRPAWTTAVVPVAASALVLLLAGCGGGSSGKSTSVAGPSSVPGAGADATKAYTDCLRANGVTVPTGRPGGGARPSGRPDGTARPSDRPSRPAGERPSGFPGRPRATDPALRKAEETCATLRPSRAPGSRGTAAPNGGPNDSGIRAFASCLHDHKVDLPPGGPSALNRTDPAVAEALKICEALLPTTHPSPAASS
ncbi:hypothetical protein [Embleya sp. NPDC020630]|uniref:hypothetical protein n=1 Tax=Embleya sp. NPDC020630 TaxID=3363979 RepID=UPI003790D0F0